LQTSVVPEQAYRFRHVLTQEVAYDTLLEHQRRALHAAAGRAIEAMHDGRLEEHLDRLAHHFSRAGEWRTAIRYGIVAADRATELGQFADASSIIDRLQDWLGHLSENAERRELLVDVLLRQERLCETLGLRARQLRLIDELIALLAPERTSAKLAEAYLRQGDVCTLLRRFDAADRALGTALRISRERGDEMGERNALRSLGLLRWHEGRSAEALEAVQGALDIDRLRGNELGEAGDLANLGIILRSLGRHDEALRLLEEALQRPVLANDPIKRSYALQNLASTLRDLGETEQALRYLEHAAADAEKHRLPVQSSFHLTAIAHMLLQDGRIDDSLRHYRRAVELSRRSRHAVGLAQSLRILGEVQLGLGQHAESLPNLREAA
ncbi:MAG: tetratricopeptide repeat protein, partial [Gemmatimonadaceae bacterium]